MKTDSFFTDLGNSLRAPDSLTLEGLLEHKKPFSIFIVLLSLALIALISYLPTLFPLEWSFSAYVLRFKEYLFACLLGRLLYHLSLSLRKNTRKLYELRKNWRIPFVTYFMTFWGIVLNWPLIGVLALSAISSFTLANLQGMSNKLREAASLGFIVILGIFVSLSSETLALLLWHELLSDNLATLTPTVFFDSLFVGFLLPLPISLGGALYFSYSEFGWTSTALVLLGFLLVLFTRFFNQNLKVVRKSMKPNSLTLALICSVSLLFLAQLSQYPGQLQWSTLSFFLTMLTFSLSLLKWRFWPTLSLGILVFCVQFSLDWLSRGGIDGV